MLRTFTTLLLAGVLSAGVLTPASAPAQELPSQDSYTLETVRPEHVPVNELFQLVQELHGRTITFADGRHAANILVGSNSIILYEEEGRLAAILESIETLDQPAPVQSSAMELLTYKPEHAHPATLFNLARELLGRQVPDANGIWKSNLSMANDTIVVNDTATRAAEVLRKIESLDATLGDSSDGHGARAEYETFEYTPKAIGLQAIDQALAPFRRQIHVTDPRQRTAGGPSAAMNLTFAHQQGMMVMRDTAENIAEVRDLLARIDVPAQQAVLTCFILSGRDQGEGDAPPALAEALHQLLPYESYSVDATGLVRIAARQGSRIGLNMTASHDQADPSSRWTYSINAQVGSYDPDSGALGLENCNAQVSRPGTSHQMFNTSTTIFRDEYAVLGVAGSDPVFVVLRLTPVSTARAH